MTLGQLVTDTVYIYENTASTCVVKEDIDTSSCVTDIFLEKFALSAALMMYELREQFFLIGGLYKTSDSTSCWASETLEGAQKTYSVDYDVLFGRLVHLLRSIC